MRILVTGCCGFIGSHLVEYLIHHTPYEVVGIDDLRMDGDQIRKKTNLSLIQDLERFSFRNENICDTKCIEEGKPHIVIHLAGLAGVRESVVSPEKYVHNNVFGHTHLLKQSILHRVQRFIYASSSSVYGWRSQDGQPFCEKRSDC